MNSMFAYTLAFDADITGWISSPMASFVGMFESANAWNAAYVNCVIDNTNPVCTGGPYGSSGSATSGPSSAWQKI
jgi:hypothetical protein